MIFEDFNTDLTQIDTRSLVVIALDDDPFSATSALNEIKQRDIELAKDTSIKIIDSQNYDKYLKSLASSILIPLYFSDLYNHVIVNIHLFDVYVVNSIMSDICDEVAVVDRDDKVFKDILHILCDYSRYMVGIDENVKKKFIKYFCV